MSINNINRILFGNDSNQSSTKTLEIDNTNTWELEKNPNINIYNFFNLVPKSKQHIINSFKNISPKRIVTYDTNDDNYYKEMFENDAINYYCSSFSNNKNGLERSQIKTLTELFKSLKIGDKFIPINGGPGTGKSTLLNYVLSNLLMNNLLEQYSKEKISNSIDLNIFLKNKYIPLKILITGMTKESVKNVIEICKLNYNDEKFDWIKLNNSEIDKIFKEINFHIGEKEENQYFNNLLLNDFVKLKPKIKVMFLESAKCFFADNSLKFDDIPAKCIELIKNNNKQINLINKEIKSKFANDNKLDNLYKELEIMNILHQIYSNINKFIYENKKKNKKEYLSSFNSLYTKIINDFDNLMKKNNNEKLSNFGKKLLQNKKFIQNLKKSKFKLLFTPIQKIRNKALYIKKMFENIIKVFSINVNGYINDLSILINLIKQIFDKNELKEIGFDDIVNIDLNNIDNKMKLKLMTLFEIIKINFNLIQSKIDIKLRSTNTYLLQHIHEWILINNFDLKEISKLKPIITTNLQKFKWSKLSSKWYGIDEKFDLIIVDESGQVDFKYLIYLTQLSDKIIAVGDEKQLECIQDAKELNHNLNSFASKEDIDFLEIELRYIKKLSKFTFNEQNKSLLQYFNNQTGIISITKNNKKGIKGLYLLEHFRCPKQVCDLFNKTYYNDELDFQGNKEFNNCNISNLYDLDNFGCNESSLMQIRYQYNDELNDNNNHLNYQELEIGLNFIIDNIEYFYKHKGFNALTNEAINYLIENIAFVALYRKQKEIICKTIKGLSNLNNIEISLKNICLSLISKIKRKFKIDKDKIIHILSNIKKGTIDSLQGIGCDFVVFSNVSKTFANKTSFEFNENRLNVLYSRVKKHFFMIIANTYWKNKTSSSMNNDQLQRFTNEIKVSDDKNWIVYNINDNTNDFPLSKLTTNKLNFKRTDVVGKYGEEMFNHIMLDPEFKIDIQNTIMDQLDIKLFINNFEWTNQDKESCMPYDFKVKTNDLKCLYIDVKSTTKSNNNDIFMSDFEIEFAIKHNYLIARIDDITKSNINIKNKGSKAYVLSHINFFKVNNRKEVINKTKTLNIVKRR